MATVTPPSITALPSPPDPANRATFNTLAYPWSAALPTFSTEVSAVAANVKANADDAAASSTTATTKAAEAIAAASAATTTANAAAWVNGGTYALNANAISGVDFQTYRKKTASSVTTVDPSADPTNWVKLGGLPDQTGKSGKYLKTNGTAESWEAVASGLTLLATLTPTAAANVDFLSAFSSTYDNYLIVIEGIKPAADDQLRMRFAVAGTTDTGSNYFIGAEGATPTATAHLAFIAAITSAGVGVGGQITIQNVNNTTNAKTGTVQLSGQTSATPSFRVAINGLGYSAANAISGFRLYWGTGSNFAATGTIRVYGYANT